MSEKRGEGRSRPTVRCGHSIAEFASIPAPIACPYRYLRLRAVVPRGCLQKNQVQHSGALGEASPFGERDGFLGDRCAAQLRSLTKRCPLLQKSSIRPGGSGEERGAGACSTAEGPAIFLGFPYCRGGEDELASPLRQRHSLTAVFRMAPDPGVCQACER